MPRPCPIPALLTAASLLTLACLAGAPSSAHGQVAPSQHAIQWARAVGLPPVDSSGTVAGPFDGPEGTLYYLNGDGLATYFHPTRYLAYFGALGPNGLSFRYGLSPLGQFVFEDGQRAMQVPVLPDDVYRWPHANAVANVLIGYLLAIRQGQLAMPQGQPDLAAWSDASRMMHETNMAIIQNMGSQGCTEYYEDVYYLGCW